MKKFMTAVLEIVGSIMGVVCLMDMISTRYPEFMIDNFGYRVDIYTDPVFGIHASVVVILFLITTLLELRQAK